MNSSFKKTAWAAALLLGFGVFSPNAFCVKKSKIDPFHMQIVGKYFESSEYFKMLKMVNEEKFKYIGQMYKANPVPYDSDVFTDIETCIIYPQEENRIVKFENKIKSIIYLENSFDEDTIGKVLKANDALGWEHEISYNDSENNMYGFNLHYYNKGKVITFCFNPFKMCKKLIKCSDKIYFERLFVNFNRFLSSCGVNGTFIDVEELKKTLKTFVVPSSVKTLCAGTFVDFEELEKVYISDFVQDISECAFINCDKLKEIHYKGKVYDNFGIFLIFFKIGPYAGYESVKDIKVLDSVEEIGENAFKGCYSLNSVYLPKSVKKICDSAFLSCSSLKEIEIPDSVTEIEAKAFKGCLSLEKVKISNNIEKIKLCTFSNCGSLTDVSIPDSVKKIGCGAFEWCIHLKNLKISKCVEEIENCAFEGCNSLTEVVIPNSVKKIDYRAFACCANLQKIKIPDSVTELNGAVFADCPSLNAIEYRNKVYKNQKDFFTAFYAGPYAGYENFKDIEIFDSISEIKPNAFTCCRSLESIKIPNSVTTIGNEAFLYCESLKNINIPDSVTRIGSKAFGGCLDLTKIDIPDSVSNMGMAVFFDCVKLSSVRLPNSIEEIGRSAFLSCRQLKNIEIPKSVKKICDHAFQECSSLEKIVIPESVEKIGKKIFNGCTSLESVQILGNINEISEGAFSGCKMLKNVNIPDSVEIIGDDAFHSCTSLEKIVIPDSVKSIGYKVFDNCTNLKSISYKGKDYNNIYKFMKDFNIQNSENKIVKLTKPMV